jgi:DNA-binding winged helix-turn-helix (wHTH) protein
MTYLAKRRVRFGPFEADLATRELWRNSIRLKLGGQPFQILLAMLENPGQLVSREELRKRIWTEDTFVDFSHGLNAAVNKLREALCDSPDEPRYIETLPRRGYRFIAKVEEARDLPLEPDVVPPKSAPPEIPLRERQPWKGSLVDEGWQSSVPVKRQTLVNLWALVAVLFLLGLGLARVGFNLWDSHSSEAAERTMKLAAEKRTPHVPGIYHLDVAHASDELARTRILDGQEAIGGPQPSPDGKKLAFMTGSQTAMDIWVSNIDGSSPRKLTNQAQCGTPRWSPDSRWIAFDSDSRFGHSGIYIVSADGGPVRGIVQDLWNNSVPSWSRDGQWIYFASDRDTREDQDQVFRISVNGYQLQQITRLGGFSPYESADGRTIYYAKNRFENPEIWEVPVAGGEEKRVSSLLHPSSWANWSVTEQGILFLSEYTGKSSTLEFFDFATHGARPLGAIENASFWLSSSLDGKSVWYSELTDEQAHGVFKAGVD